jgi:multifunctional cyclase/dehydratase/O-methyltransferase
METMFGLYDNRVLGLLVELDIPEHLDAPKSATELASLTSTDAAALDRVLRYAVGRGYLTMRRGKYRANAVTRVLRRDDANSWRPWVEFVGSDWIWDSWRHLDAAVRGERSGTEAATGHEFFAYVNRVRPDAGAVFNAAMRAGSTLQALALLDAFDWSSVSSVCDVGGGTGALLARLLDAHPHLWGTLVDLPEVIANALPSLPSRCELVSGSFFDELPPGRDRYTLLAIVHDWDDDRAARILGRVRDALPPRGRAIVVENVLSDEPRDEFAAASDVMMLVLATGRERTRSQFDALFARGGLTLVRTVPLASGFTAFELSNSTR